ncbi:hypothetical protein [Streptosporangium sp. KLBMP 9127]|nr:hypothetical protein [Streptosporangium sp. KLBMP 9127]
MRALIVAVLGALALLAAGGLFWVSGDLREAQAATQERQAAIRAAGTYAVNLLSVNHKSVEGDIERVLATSTGVAKKAYASEAARLKKVTLDDKVMQTGVLRSVGLVSMRGGTASVLVVADAVIRWEGSDEAPQELFRRWSMEVTKVGGTWLVSKAEQVL